MQVSRLIAGSMAAVTATLGLSLATVGPAAASSTGSWRAFGNTNPITSSSSTWKCAATMAIAVGVNAQVCAVRSASGNSVQGAVIVRNNNSGLFDADAGMEVDRVSDSGFVGEWACSGSGVAANSWSVCFGPSVTEVGVEVWADGTGNGVSLGQSPGV